MSRPASLALLTLLGLGTAAEAGTFTVIPATVEIDSRQDRGLLLVTNRGDREVRYQVEAYATTAAAIYGRSVTTALAVTPPLVVIPPGATRRVSIAPTWLSDAGAEYEVLVREVAEMSLAGKPLAYGAMTYVPVAFTEPPKPGTDAARVAAAGSDRRE